MARTHGAAVFLQEPGMGVKNICVAVKATPGLEDLKTKDIKQEAIRQRAVLKQAGTAAVEGEPQKKTGLDLLLGGGSAVVATKPTLHPSWKRCETGALLAIFNDERPSFTQTDSGQYMQANWNYGFPFRTEPPPRRALGSFRTFTSPRGSSRKRCRSGSRRRRR
jgi:hypothetical protein